MINKTDNPVAWSLLLYEIDDLRQHVDDLATEMSERGEISEEEFRVDIGHAYAHLNRVWNARNDGTDDAMVRRHHEFSRFPADIEPMG